MIPPLVALVEVIVGAAGMAAGVTADEADEAGLSPTPLVAVAVTV